RSALVLVLVLVRVRVLLLARARVAVEDDERDAAGRGAAGRAAAGRDDTVTVRRAAPRVRPGAAARARARSASVDRGRGVGAAREARWSVGCTGRPARSPRATWATRLRASRAEGLTGRSPAWWRGRRPNRSRRCRRAAWSAGRRRPSCSR